MTLYYCIECSIYMGEIRDATLRRGFHILCNNCNIKRAAKNMMKNGAKDFDFLNEANDLDFLNDILFRGKKW